MSEEDRYWLYKDEWVQGFVAGKQDFSEGVEAPELGKGRTDAARTGWLCGYSLASQDQRIKDLEARVAELQAEIAEREERDRDLAMDAKANDRW